MLGSILLGLASSVIYYVLLGAWHELAHILAGILVGCPASCNLKNLMRSLWGRQVHIKTPPGWRTLWVRHAGWLASLGTAVLVLRIGAPISCSVPAAVTAVEALLSDLLQSWALAPEGFFLCGNFGMVILHKTWASSPQKIKDALEKMVEVTMMRGAQSGGVVTFVGEEGNVRGLRARVVNLNRTTLSTLLRARLNAVEWWARWPLLKGRVPDGGPGRF